jgi:hypothetical protein
MNKTITEVLNKLRFFEDAEQTKEVFNDPVTFRIQILNPMYIDLNSDANIKAMRGLITKYRTECHISSYNPKNIGTFSIENSLESEELMGFFNFIKEINDKMPNLSRAYFKDFTVEAVDIAPNQMIIGLDTESITLAFLLKLVILIAITPKLNRLFNTEINIEYTQGSSIHFIVLNSLLLGFDFSVLRNRSLSREDRKYVLNKFMEYFKNTLRIKDIDDLNAEFDKKIIYVLPQNVVSMNKKFLTDLESVRELIDYLISTLNSINTAFNSNSNALWNDCVDLLSTNLSSVTGSPLSSTKTIVKEEMLKFLNDDFIKESSMIPHSVVEVVKKYQSDEGMLKSFVENENAIMEKLLEYGWQNKFFDEFGNMFIKYAKNNVGVKEKLKDVIDSKTFLSLVYSKSVKSLFIKKFVTLCTPVTYYISLISIFNVLLFNNLIKVKNAIHSDKDNLEKLYASYIHFCYRLEMAHTHWKAPIVQVAKELVKLDNNGYSATVPANSFSKFSGYYDEDTYNNTTSKIRDVIDVLTEIRDTFIYCRNRDKEDVFNNPKGRALEKVVSKLIGEYYPTLMDRYLGLLNYFIDNFEKITEDAQ